MKVRSSIRPNKFHIRKTELGNSYVKLRRNIQEKEVEYGESIDIVYEYDEVEVVVVNRANLAEYITEHFDKLFEIGLKMEDEMSEPTMEEVQLEYNVDLDYRLSMIEMRLI